MTPHGVRMWVWVQDHREAAAIPVLEAAPSLAAGSRGSGCLEPATASGRGGLLAATSPTKVKGSQGTGIWNCCSVPPGGPRRCPLRSAWNGGGEEGGRGSPSPKLPSTVLQKQAWAALRSQARSSEVLVWYPGTRRGRGGAVLGRQERVWCQPVQQFPQDVLFPFPPPPHQTAAPESVPLSATCPDIYWVLFLWSQHGWWRWKGDREVSRLPRPVPPHPRPGSWSLNRKFVLKGGQEFPKPVLGAEGRH